MCMRTLGVVLSTCLGLVPVSLYNLSRTLQIPVVFYSSFTPPTDASIFDFERDICWTCHWLNLTDVLRVKFWKGLFGVWKSNLDNSKCYQLPSNVHT